jgi:hypothetical protein
MTLALECDVLGSMLCCGETLTFVGISIFNTLVRFVFQRLYKYYNHLTRLSPIRHHFRPQILAHSPNPCASDSSSCTIY